MDAEKDAEAFARLLELVGEITDTTVSASRVTMYFGALQRYDYPIVQQAINQHVAVSAYFPKPAEIRNIIEGTEAERESNIWLALDEAIRKIGVWQSVIVADPVLAAAIIRVWGSWIAMCAFRNENEEFLWNSKRRDFIAAYKIAAKDPRRYDDPVLLAGHCERENQQTGRFPSRQHYGAILLDGRVETRYLDINSSTGLPALPLKECLTLQPASTRLALQAVPEGETGNELDATDARSAIEQALQRLVATKTFPERGIVTKDDPDAERRAVLREQAKAINGEVESTQPPTNDVRPTKNGRAGKSNRATDSRGGTAGTDGGIRVRDRDRSKVGGGLRVAGVPDPARDRGGRVRERGELRAGLVDNKKGRRRKG